MEPGGHPPEARRLLAILALAIAWWITEAIPLPATALFASALAIAAGVAPARQVLAPFADPVIFLFLGSFLLAEAVSRYGIDVRIASWLLGLPVFARTASGRMAAFGTASAAISTVLSNTATAALMTPIALGALGEKGEGRPRRTDSGVLLMIAYGASVGGMATIIGTPPNLLVAGFLERLAGVRVTFTGWLVFGVPIALTLLLVSLALTRFTLGRGLAEPLPDLAAPPPVAGRDDAAGERRAGARWTVLAFSLAFALWLAPSVAQGVLGREHPVAAALGKHFPEAGVALLCATLLFVAPISWRKRRFALSWADGQRVNWGVLMLFGGGLSLGTLGEATGIAKWAGEGVVTLRPRHEPGELHAPVRDRGRHRQRVRVEHRLRHPARADRDRRRAPGRVRPRAARPRRRPRRDLRLRLPGLDAAERDRLRHRPRAPHAHDPGRRAPRRRVRRDRLGGSAPPAALAPASGVALG